MGFKLNKIILALALLFIMGCVQAKDFSYGLKQLNEINSRYNTTIDTYPKNMQRIDAMLNEFRELKNQQTGTAQQPLINIINYRIINLEAEKLYIRGQEYGPAGSTKDGFGCKSRPLITESVSFRNMSALKGFEAVAVLREFILQYPEEAKAVSLSEKNALFLNATFYQIYLDAGQDSRIINYFCPLNVTLDLYKEEFRKTTNMTKDFIDNIDYEHAAPIWKKIRGIS